MTMTASHATVQARGFTQAEGLRMLLVRLHYAGPRAWETDTEAAELMAFTMHKYAALAHKHGLEPEDAAVAAFEVMRTRAARVAADPWAVVTRAVQLSLVYEERAHGLLCSPQQARRTTLTGCHDAERFSDREIELADYHPALQVTDPHDFAEHAPAASCFDRENDTVPTNAFVALDAAVGFFVDLGWPEHAARMTLEYIATRLIRTGTRLAAYESLRHDPQAPALLDISHAAWLTVLRVVLGNQHPDRIHTAAGRGILLRLLVGQQVSELFADTAVADAIEATAPGASPWAEGRDESLSGDRHV